MPEQQSSVHPAEVAWDPAQIDFSTILKEGFHYTDVLGPALNQILRMAHADGGFIYLLPATSQSGVTHCFSGLDPVAFNTYLNHPSWAKDSLGGLSLKNLRIMMRNGTEATFLMERMLLGDNTNCVLMASPIHLKQRGLGVAVVIRQQLEVFTFHEVEILQGICAHIAISLENARLFEILHRGKNEWERTFDAILDMLAIVNPHALIMRANRSLASRLNTHPRQLVGQNYHKVFYGDYGPPSNCPLLATIEAHAAFAEEITNPSIGADFLISTAPLFNHNQEFLGAVVLARDISERKRLEGELRQQRDYLSNILRNSPDAIIATDLNGRVLEFNRSAEQMMGCSRREMLNRSWLELFFTAESQQYINGFISAQKDIRNYSTQIMTKSGASLEINLTLSYLRDEAGRPVGTVSIGKDVTEINRLNRQLVQAEKLSSIGELVAGVAHELNNPLTSIMGFTELVIESQTDDQTRKDLEKIRKQGKRMQRIVQNLLRFSRQYPPEKCVIDLNEVLRTTLELKQYELKLSNISITDQLSIKPLEVLADPNQLGQVFLNLINNAHHAIQDTGKPGMITLFTSLKGSMALISISDTGVGISKENMLKIFDPFFTTKPVGKGTGLGLSVSFGIIKEHGGNIYAESRLNEGTTFFVELPVGPTPSGSQGS